MSATYLFRAFCRNESGAASVDWVVLAAACVGLGMGVTNVVATELSELSQEVRAELQRDMLNNPFDINETELGSNGCAHLYLDPQSAASSSAAYLANGCSTAGGSNGNNGFGNGTQPAPGNSAANNNAANAQDSYSVVISDDDDD